MQYIIGVVKNPTVDKGAGMAATSVGGKSTVYTQRKSAFEQKPLAATPAESFIREKGGDMTMILVGAFAGLAGLMILSQRFSR